MNDVYLDEHAINIFINNPTLVKEFPFLNKKIKIPSACCGGYDTVVDYQYIKEVIFNLPSNKIARFKELAGINNLIVRNRNNNVVL